MGVVLVSRTCESRKSVKRGKVAQAQKEREPVSRFPLEKCLFIRFRLAEVTLQQALERLAVAGLVAGQAKRQSRSARLNNRWGARVWSLSAGTPAVLNFEKSVCKV